MSDSFICKNCGKKVLLTAPGTHHRNHCPGCLCSVHVDSRPGDRFSDCGGIMIPVGKIYKTDGEEVLVHQCSKCHTVRKNRVAGDDDGKIIDKLPVLDFVNFESQI